MKANKKKLSLSFTMIVGNYMIFPERGKIKRIKMVLLNNTDEQAKIGRHFRYFLIKNFSDIN